jgi:hypothetical protein
MHEFRRWMTLFEAVNEDIASYIKSGYAQGEFPVYKNGDRAEFMTLWKERLSKNEEVRGLLYGDDLYFWDAFIATHYAIRAIFTDDQGFHLMMWPDRLVINDMWRIERVMPARAALTMIENHPRVRAIYGPRVKIVVQG